MAAMNPQLGVALRNPQVRAMMSNPAFIRQMTDPNTMQVINSISIYCSVLIKYASAHAHVFGVSVFRVLHCITKTCFLICMHGVNTGDDADAE